MNIDDIQALIATHAQYNHWANSFFVKWLQTLDGALLAADTPSSFRGIALTLQHMVQAQNFWLAVITVTINGRGDEPFDASAGISAMQHLLDGSQKNAGYIHWV